MSKPYTFQPVFAIDEAMDLGRRLVGGHHGLAEFKDASGIAGCALEKLDGDPAQVMAASEDLSDKSLEELGEMLLAAPATDEAGGGAFLAWLLPIITQIILRLIQDRFGGGSTNPTPGPV